ncbi:MAG: LPS export ABC transporter periplasmic protein LptC [Candidatus Dadabacteria bacterium]|nr:MAG: LPS export ABC transporter periplasmic protein LptC [Candidatus Dadabacteria bacterium]
MRLSRTNSRMIVVLAVLLFVGGGAYLLSRGKQSNFVGKLVKGRAEKLLSLGSAFVLNNFHRIEMKGNRKKWEVRAKRGQYFAGEQKTVLSALEFTLYRDNGEVVIVDADKGELEFDGNELFYAKLTGNVVIKLGNKMSIYSDKAFYDNTSNSVFTPGYARIVSDKLTIKGVELSFDLTTKVATFQDSVETFIKGRNGKNA